MRCLPSFLAVLASTVTLFTLGACSTKTIVSGPGSGGTAPPSAASAAGLGQSCTAACGSGDGRKCSMPSADCPSNLCLVDSTQPIEHLAYCSVDCTSSACPEAYHCEAIEAFENDSVKSACVADPASCGDGVVQLGEVCDGDSDQGKCSADCQTLTGICGDGIVQTGEVCDGDTSDGYCVECKSIAKPSISLTSVSLNGHAFDSGNIDFTSSADLKGPVPSAGDASGCGGIQIVEQTAELLRLRVKFCSSSSSLTWTFALPLVNGTYVSSTTKGWDSAKWQPTAVLQNTAGNSYSFSGDWGTQLDVAVNTIPVEPGAPAYEHFGSILVLYGSAGETTASMQANFDLLPPKTP